MDRIGTHVAFVSAFVVASVSGGMGGTNGVRIAHAQSPNDQLLAESLFDQGRALMDQGRFAEACPKLAESQRLDPGGGTILNLAICHEREGRLATAYTEMMAALTQATRDGRKDREAIAREHTAALAPRLPKLAVHVVDDEDGLEVRVDGAPVRRPAWDVAAGVDPGRHLIEAEVPGKPRFRTEVVLAEREERVIEIPSFRPPMAGPMSRGPQADRPHPAADGGSNSKNNPAYYGALTVGTVGMIVGSLTGIGWLQARLARGSNCVEDRNFCNQDGLDAASRERTFGAVTAVSLGVGVVALGSLLFIPSSVDVPVQTAIAPRPGGAVLSASIALP